MGKEYLEAFNRIALHAEYDNDGSYDCLKFEDDCKLVDEALQRLEAIENVKTSEALQCLDKLNKLLNYVNIYKITEIEKDVNTIKQALLKVEKDKAKIEKLKHDNAILHIQLDTFKKIAFKNKGE